MKFDTEQLSRLFKGIRYGNVMHPSRDWLVILCGGLLLLCVSVLFNVWLFNKVVRGELSGTYTPVAASHTLEELGKIRTLLEERQGKVLYYKTSATFIDPSRVTE